MVVPPWRTSSDGNAVGWFGLVKHHDQHIRRLETDCQSDLECGPVLWFQRLLDQIDATANEVHLVMSAHAKQVAAQEVEHLAVPQGVIQHAENDLNVPFVSGSARFDAMVIVPCSMATLGRIASGVSDSALLRAADVFLKERRKLIVVPRETPWSLIHARNVVTLLEAGAIVLPAIPSYYSRPRSVDAVVDTVVWRILDQTGLPNPRAYRWKDESAHPSPP
jgi:4-hydroxy-3-polyprenylbenzoate decarboxylase